MSDWVTAKLKEVAKVVTGKTPQTSNSEYYGGDIPFVSPADLNEGILSETKTYLTSSGADQVYRVPKNTVLVSCIGNLGKLAITAKEVCFNQQINGLIFDEQKIFPKYGFYFAQTIKPQLEKASSSTTLPIVNKSRFSDLEIKYPPLAEQRRIASILDQADELRQKRQQAIEKLDQLLQSTFIEMFGDPVSNPKGWEKVEVGKVTTCIVPGRDKPKSFTGSIPWITTDDLNSLGYTSQSKKRMGLTQTEIDDVRAKVIPFQSVVMSCVGNLGITSIANNEFVMNQQLHSYQCLEQITPEFLMFCLPFEKNYMFSRATSTTLPYMNKSVCNSVPVILPPIDLQEKWSKILLNIEEHKQSLYKQLDMQNQLFSALQNQAFNGTL